MAEKILVNYDHRQTYTETDTNIIGATTNTTLRTVTAHSDSNCKYVKKFGTTYSITQVTDIEDPIDTDMTFTVKALDGTTLGSRVGGGAFVAGSTLATAQGCYLVVSATGACTVLTGITIDTNVDAGGLTLVCPAEVLGASETLTLYISSSGSTYYDSVMKHGGDRHTPDGTEKYPYFKIQDAINVVDSYHTIVTVLDSETYDEELNIDYPALTLQSALGYTPTITYTIGASAVRDVTLQYNNLTACYWNNNGNDGTGDGTWQAPYLTANTAITNRGSKHVVYGGTGASSVTITLSGAITLNAGFNFEIDYGLMPILSGGSITITNGSANVYGANIYKGQIFSENITYSGIIQGNNIYDSTDRGIELIYSTTSNFSGTIQRNKIYNCTNQGMYLISNLAGGNGSILNNVIYNNGQGGIRYQNEYQANAVTVKNNLFYNNGNYGLLIYVEGAVNFTGVVENNTSMSNKQGNTYTGYGIYIYSDGANYLGTLKNNITYNNNKDMVQTGTGAITFTYTDYETTQTISAGAGCITTDPAMTSEAYSYYGISGSSGAYQTDSNSDDMGRHARIVKVDGSSVTINGFIFDGNDKINNAIYKKGINDYTGIAVKWCTFYKFTGIAVDLYDNDTALSSSLLNNKFYSNGDGAKTGYGSLTIQENLFYNNFNYGLYLTYADNYINHNVFFANKYGIYANSTVNSTTIKNCIFSENTDYGIYSDNIIEVTYCCISDPYNANVDVTANTNIFGNPLFISTDADAEDFHIKTTEGGYTKESVCKEIADDGYDIGAYLVTRVVSEDYWGKYEFAFNPQVSWTNELKGYLDFRSASGAMDNYAIDSKRIFQFDFSQRQQVSTEAIRQKLEYFTTLIKTQSNQLAENRTKFRIHFQPTSYLESGTGATVTSTTHNIADSTKDWIENQWKGYHVGIKFTYGTATGSISAITKKVAVSPSPTWTNDEWIGYYMYYNGYYYYILDNDADELTLSDPDDTIVSASNINWNIEKYFKIRSNTKNVLCVTDSDSELVTGTYDYYINFIECKIYNDKFNYSQPMFLYTREHSKTGYSITFEEC